MTYGAVSNVTAGLDLVTNGLADFLVTDGALSSAQLGAGKLRVPLIGSAIVAAYHLPSLTATDPPLVRSWPLFTHQRLHAHRKINTRRVPGGGSELVCPAST